MYGGIGIPGFTSVSNTPRHSPPRYFTAPTSVISSRSGEVPVVSRSSTTKVTSQSGVARASKRSGSGGEVSTLPVR